MAQSYYSVIAFLSFVALCGWKFVQDYQTRQVFLGLFFNGIQAHTNSRLTSYSPSSMDVYQRLESRTRDLGE